MGKSKCAQLNDGNLMPYIGLGTSKIADEHVETAVSAAIDAGYRLLDCSIFYGNERAIGRVLKTKIEEGTIKREEMFITGKIWRTFNKKENMEECINESLKQLGISYFDLYLVHYPNSLKYGGLKDLLPRDKDGKILIDEDTDYVDVWRNIQRFKKDGRAVSLGVSNFNSYQLKRLIDETNITPTVNQIEFHPYLTQHELIRFCHRHNIIITAYCCVGASDRAASFSGNFLYLLEDQVLIQIAEKHKKTSAQVALRFCIEQNICAVPKSQTPCRIKENIDVFDFKLDETDMDQLLALNRKYRYLPASIDEHHKFHPFRKDYTEEN